MDIPQVFAHWTSFHCTGMTCPGVRFRTDDAPDLKIHINLSQRIHSLRCVGHGTFLDPNYLSSQRTQSQPLIMSTADFASFQKSFTGELVTASSPPAVYEAAIARWAKNAIRRARIVAFVKNPQDVAAAIKYARAAGLGIAIRGGGHSPVGASSAEDGLVIDLSKFMRGVRVDEEKRLAYVGGGALWRDVNEATIKHGLVTVAGTINHVCIYALAFFFRVVVC